MVHSHSSLCNLPDIFIRCLLLCRLRLCHYNITAQSGLMSAPVCRHRRALRHLLHSINEHCLIHCSCHPSVLKLFTGFAMAALIAWKLIVKNAITIALLPAMAKTHQEI